MAASTLQERQRARALSTQDRVNRAAGIVEAFRGEQFLIWCNLNVESEAATKAIPGAVEIRGSHSPEYKTDMLLKFINGEVKVLVSKPSICGFGLNLQNCHNVIYLGLSDSYEEFYQSSRRCWRFGQKKDVILHIITADTEGAVIENIKRKDREATEMAEAMIEHTKEITKESLHGSDRWNIAYKENMHEGKDHKVFLGDCCEVAEKLADESVHFSIFSPPFASLYTYSNSPRDMGNSRDYDEFGEHFSFLVKQLYRVLIPGRLVSFHCMNLPTSKTHHGYIGIHDFRGDLIKTFEREGFIYHSEVCIWKDPVTAMQRTKALGLLHKQLKKDSAMSRQGIPDYLVTMRKPGENPERITHTNESFPVSVWQRYASPIWMDINPSDTLQYRSARDHKDEKHICPLQLTVIRRAIELWTNPGDIVFSPFAGIGSEGYQALKMGRKYIGIELKESYYKQACRNLNAAIASNGRLFEVEESQELLSMEAI